MASIKRKVFGGRWALADRAAKPSWVQIEEQLADRIEAGHLAPGQRLPAERDLALALSVSRMTVRQALASLAARGLVERGVGRGTFVRQVGRVVHDLTRVAGFTEEVERQGLAPGAPVVRLERVRLGGGRPMTLEDTWVPAARFPGLLDRDLSGSLYAIMRAEYDLGPVSATERLEPVAARSYEADALEVAEGSP